MLLMNLSVTDVVVSCYYGIKINLRHLLDTHKQAVFIDFETWSTSFSNIF
jgi:hypothetical protein